MNWLTTGITTNQSGGWIHCESTHLTAFSVLLDPESGRSIAPHHKATLNSLSYVGAVLSITGLLCTIVTYAMFRYVKFIFLIESTDNFLFKIRTKVNKKSTV